MRIATTLATAAWLAALGPPAVGGGGTAGPPAYRLKVRVDPAAGTIDCTVEIREPRSAAFALTRDMRIRRVLADGKRATFDESPPAAADAVREITVRGPVPREIVVEYAGRVVPESYPRLVSQVNMVRGGLVELAGYVGWYPRLKAPGPFLFRLTADLPEDLVAWTNGRLVRRAPPTRGRAVTEWQSLEPAGDIVLVAAPGLRTVTATRASLRLELHSARLPRDYLGAMKDDVASAVGVLSDIAGAPPPGDLVRVVYSPRPGWGYVRRPLIVVSEETALAARAERFGRARDLRYVAHEIAHYWWHLADTSTPDDWVNEGLAEYLALRASERVVGREFADQLLGDYRLRSATSATTSAIAETDGSSPDREVNRYARPVLVLTDVQRRYGDGPMKAFVQALYRRFVDDGKATTASSLDEAGRRLGPEAREGLAAALARRDWSDATPRYICSPEDVRFLGTWTGALTQAGETNRVILHLALRDDALVATIDSPEQGARDIPVPVVRVSGSSLFFGLGAFGVSYEGVLSDDASGIRGTWTQAGAGVPLELTKVAVPR